MSTANRSNHNKMMLKLMKEHEEEKLRAINPYIDIKPIYAPLFRKD